MLRGAGPGGSRPGCAGWRRDWPGGGRAADWCRGRTGGRSQRGAAAPTDRVDSHQDSSYDSWACREKSLIDVKKCP